VKARGCQRDRGGSVATSNANDVTLARQFDWPASAAAKILISREGYYRITRAQLVAAGFDPGTDARTLSLFVDGRRFRSP
jgi:hypothetical protein